MADKMPAVERLAKFADSFDASTDHIEGIAIGLVSRAGPWFAILPTAYTVYAQTNLHLDWPPWVSAAAGIAVEVLGLSTVRQALKLREYNLTRKKYPPEMTKQEKAKSKMVVDPPAPAWLANALVTVYFLAAELLAIGLDIGPKLLTGQQLGLVAMAPAVFPILSLAGTITLGLRADHRHRLAKISEREAERKGKKELRQLAQALARAANADAKVAQVLAETDNAGARLAQVLAETDKVGARLAQGLSADERRAQLLDIWRQGDGDNFTDLAPMFGVSRQTISNDFVALRKAGKVKKNGQGIEVLV